MKTLIASLIVLSSCTSPASNSQASVAVKQPPKTIDSAKGISSETIEKSRLLGRWTDGSTENATFDISSDSIFYMDEMTSFPYTIKGDSITIIYPDMSFQGIAMFLGDTLVLSDPEFGTTKYVRFKN